MIMEDSSHVCWTVVFEDSPYKELNDVKIDAKDLKAIGEMSRFGFNFGRKPITEANFKVFYSDADKHGKFLSWYKDVFSTCNSRLGNTKNYFAKAMLYMYDGDNRKLLRKYSIYKVFPVEMKCEYDDYNEVTFNCALGSIEDLTEDEKKMNDEKELSSILKKAQPYVELISLLDKVEEHIDKHGVPSPFESIGKEFARSLNRYNSILKDSCVSIMKDAYK